MRPRTRGETARRWSIAGRLPLLVAILLSLAPMTAVAQVRLPEPNSTAPIVVSAQAGNQWRVGQYEVWVLRGNCAIQQGQAYARCAEAVLWIDRTEPGQQEPSKVIAYLEGGVDVVAQPGEARVTDQTWFGRFWSTTGVQVAAATVAGQPDTLPPVYWRGMERRTPEPNDAAWRARVEPAQYAAPGPVATSNAPTPNGPEATPLFPATRPGALPTMAPSAEKIGPGIMVGGGRRIRVYPRSDVPVNAQSQVDPSGTHWTTVIDSGVNVIVDGLGSIPGMGEIGTIDISTDRIVIWTTGNNAPNLQKGETQDGCVPLEFYMEGNIVFRQGERIIYASRMYYDVPNRVGTVLDAEMLTPVGSYEGLLRLHADVLQQTAQDRYYAKNTFITSSRMGDPTYRLQAGDLSFEDIATPAVDGLTGQPLLNPRTNEPVMHHERMATSTDNVLFMGPVPVFYWPTLATDLNDPTYYIRRAALGQDGVFGTQILTHWNGYQLLGIRNRPAGTDFDVSFDYLSKRGFGYGGTFTYNRDDVFGLSGPTGGLLDAWAIQDHGTDDLGQERRDVPLEATYRFRVFGQHRQRFENDLQFSAELGWISDRNFLEEYYKSEWEQLKDESTGIELKRITGNNSWSLSVDYRINDFFTQTNWLPRADHFWMGQSLFGDVFTWYEHSNAAYGELRHTTIPANTINSTGNGAAGPFNYLPWEQNDAQGERFATRQEIDWPFQIGDVKVVPYALGEAAHWGQDVNGQSLDRLFGQVGMRASLPMWSVNPAVSSDLFNVHGIAHKVVFDAEVSVADSNRNLEDLPLYDAVDDDSVEAWRRRLLTMTFGVPSMAWTTHQAGTPWFRAFDERFYAIRTGQQSWVSSPSTELADDLSAVRLGAHQRWQTKRGPVNNRRIIDWITFDTNITIYPDADRDNEGTAAGLLDYNFRWHVGDRLTLVSDAIFDFFNQGQKIVSVGGFLTRPPRGSLYMGFSVLEGPTNLNSQVLSFSYNYWMSPKWVSSFGTSIDFGNQGNLGQNFSVTRVGESFLVSAGFTVDASRNNVGAVLMVEPRFLPKSRLGSVGGAQIPPAGAYGLE